MLKIFAILNNVIGSGGGFDQALNAIIQMQKICIGRFDFKVITTEECNVKYLDRLDVHADVLRITVFDKLLLKLSQNNFFATFQSHFKVIGPFERYLIKSGCDLVYFVTSSDSSAMLQKLNYITTVWDLCHREYLEFPEVREINQFFIREKHFHNNLSASLLIITESERLSELTSQYYGIDKDRFLAMPLTPSPFLTDCHAIENNAVLKKYSLEPGYYFYPAQLWAHKNHIRILQALLILREKHSWTPSLVFSGKDYGNLGHIKKFIETHKLESQVKILGFVPSEDMRGLYESSRSVIMPTYFGPTNLPPLEAWALGIPLIYSSHLKEQSRNAALSVDPDNAQELADAMLLCSEPEVCSRLVLAGLQRLTDIAHQRRVAEVQLCKVLERFAVRRQCWS